jgi:hypothetical protein
MQQVFSKVLSGWPRKFGVAGITLALVITGLLASKPQQVSAAVSIDGASVVKVCLPPPSLLTASPGSLATTTCTLIATAAPGNTLSADTRIHDTITSAGASFLDPVFGDTTLEADCRLSAPDPTGQSCTCSFSPGVDRTLTCTLPTITLTTTPNQLCETVQLRIGDDTTGPKGPKMQVCAVGVLTPRPSP